MQNRMPPLMRKPIKFYDYPHPLCSSDSRSNLRPFDMVRLSCVSASALVLGDPSPQTRLKFMLSAHLKTRARFCHAKWRRGKILKCFGNARLIKRPDGKHELVGGDENNYTEAKEWVSLFAHEVVFTWSCRAQRRTKGSEKPSSETQASYSGRESAIKISLGRYHL
jgi:hypothetical protein